MQRWVNLAIGAGVSFSILATLYRTATLNEMSGYAISASRLIIPACFALPVILLAERLLHVEKRAPPSPVDAFTFAIGVGFPILACVAGAFMFMSHGLHAESSELKAWGIATGIAFVGAIVAVLNVEMVSDAARNGINPSFPLSIASACYLVLTFLINVALFGELDQGIALYWKEHWTRVVALVLVVFAVIMAYK